ncbi:MAG: four helix bundle protein [Bacteroidota bacterium]
MRDFKQLKVWQNAHEVTMKIYQSTISFPKEEQYGLISQMRRSSASVATNIAEGCGRSTEKEPAKCFDIAMGSASELEYQLLLAKDLNFLKPDDFQEINEALIANEKQLNAFIQKLRKAKGQTAYR